MVNRTLKLDLWLFYAKNTLCESLSFPLFFFLLSTQLSTRVPRLTSEKCCHVGVHVGLGIMGPCKLSSNFPCSRRLMLHGWTSSDLGRVWTGPQSTSKWWQKCYIEHCRYASVVGVSLCHCGVFFKWHFSWTSLQALSSQPTFGSSKCPLSKQSSVHFASKHLITWKRCHGWLKFGWKIT